MTVTEPQRAVSAVPSTGVVVLGMHRSGTSAVTRVLNLLGAHLGSRLMPAVPNNNEKGFWESVEVADINEQLLGGIGRSWHDVRRMPAGWLDSAAASRAQAAITSFVAAEMVHEPLWAVKDPRLCRLWPVWRRALGDVAIDPGIVVVVRHPLEVAGSLHARDRLPRSHAVLLWLRSIIDAERATRGCRRTLVTYEELLLNWSGTVARVAGELGMTWPRPVEEVSADVDAFLDAGDRHHTLAASAPIDDSVGPPGLAALLAQLFRRCVDASADAAAWAALEATVDRIEPRLDAIVGPDAALDASFGRAVPATASLAATLPWVAGQTERALEVLAVQRADLDDVRHALRRQAAALEEQRAELREQAAAIARLVASVDAHTLRLDAHALQLDAPSAGLAACQSDIATLQQEVAVLRERERVRATRRRFARLRRRAPDGPRYGPGGTFLREMFYRLPLSERGKQVLKDRAFLLLAPLIRGTSMYKRWTALRTQPDGTTLVPAEPATGASTIAHYLTDLWQHAERWNDPDHVERPAAGPPAGPVAAKLIAFYLPQYHPIPENDVWWGKGFTEWSNVAKAVPQFVGHYQPRLPGELGFYDLRLTDVMRRQVELASAHGIHAFCFYYYWFSGRRLLQLPLEQFVASGIDFPFCICWANENWTRKWDGYDDDVLVAQRYLPDDDLAFIRDVEPLLRDARYVRIEGKPLLIVYRPSLLPDAGRTLERWREHCRAVGIGEVFLAMVQFDVEDPRTYGFDAAIEFPPHKVARGLPPLNGALDIVNARYAGFVVDYRTVIEQARKLADPDYALFRGVFPSWDNEARQPGRGYTFALSSPARYREWLRLAIDYARRRPVGGERVVFVNAWNEWAEGAYLEPDRRYGYAYLQATREAVTAGEGAAEEAGIAIVSHDAHPHGAQYIALAIARGLTRTFGRRVEVVLLGPGQLEAEFANVAPVHRLDGRDPAGDDACALARGLAERGIRLVLLNTTVSGPFAAALKGAGIRVTGLVHELPGVIEQQGLEAHAEALAEHADLVVFPAEAVEQAFRRFATVDDARVRIRPQGVLKHNRFTAPGPRGEARRRLRLRLGIAGDARVVLCVGYADHRKGVDLFVEAAAHVARHDPRAHFVWLGHFDISIEADVRRAAADTGVGDRIFFLDRDPDTDVYYAGADVYALMSREDPFPCVVLEALQCGLPVVGFETAGGFLPLLRRCGRLAPAFDSAALAAAVRGLLDDPAAAAACAAAGRELIRQDYSFRTYLFDLLEHGAMAPQRVSVIVPNFNYSTFLPARLATICRQHVPVFEIIVLDDASTDDSIEVVDRLEGELGVPIRVVRNEQNSGSVFHQWRRGVEMARGDYLWIAEADDLSDPAFLQKVLAPLADPKVVLSYCQSKMIDAAGQLLAEDYLEYTDDVSAEHWREPYIADGKDEVARFLAVKNTIPNVSAVVFRRDAIAAALAEAADDVLSYRIAGDWRVYVTLLRYGHVAFHPAALNLHRRHAGGVTIGSDRLPHLVEILRMQKYVREHFDVHAATQAAARRYAQALYEYFDLATSTHPTVDTREDAARLLR